ncbi:MAG: tRNA epoxyqueuosine(34) reductase QueG [Gemmatimonadota bacterium]
MQTIAPVTSADVTARVKTAALALGFDLVGVARAAPVADAPRLAEWLARGHHGTMGWMAERAELRGDPRALLPGCRSVLCVALTYYRPADESPQPAGTAVARYAWGQDYHQVLRDKLTKLLDQLRELAPGAEGRIATDSAPVMEKYWAERAGLGWRGKNTNVINTRRGSFFFLGEILTTAELVADPPAADHCGTCTRCLEACPTGALVEPYLLDSRRCIAYWTIEQRGELAPEQEVAMGEWLFGCDICQDVCPWNRDPPLATEARCAPQADAWPDEIDGLLALSPAGFRARFAETAVERTRRRGFVRNAAIVAGNTGRGSADALAAAMNDADPVVSGAAGRALARRAILHPCGTPRLNVSPC